MKVTCNVTDNSITRLSILATDENLGIVLDAVEAALSENDCPMAVISQIQIAVEEMFVNVAHYAYKDTPDGVGEAQIELECAPGVFRMLLMDQGVPYNPLEKEDPDITLSAEERDIGGLGIFMVKKMMDEVSYEHDGTSNRLTFVKKF